MTISRYLKIHGIPSRSLTGAMKNREFLNFKEYHENEVLAVYDTITKKEVDIDLIIRKKLEELESEEPLAVDILG